MTSLKCMGCIEYRTGGMLLAVIQIVIGITMGILGPLVYDMYFYSYNLGHYYSSDNYAEWIVTVGGSLLVIGGILLLLGIGCKNICLIRFHVSLTAIVEVAYIVCGILIITDGYEVIQAIGLFVVSFWIIFSAGFISKYGRIMIAGPIPMAQDFGLRVVTQAPQVVPPPVIQNDFINQTSYSSTTNNNQPPPPQPNQPFNYPNHQYSYPYSSAHSNQSANYQPNRSVSPQQYDPHLQTYPNAPGRNAYENPSYNPAMSPQFNRPSSPMYSAAPPAPPMYNGYRSSPSGAPNNPPSFPNSNPPYNPRFQSR